MPIFLSGGKIELQKGIEAGRKHPPAHELEQYFGKTVNRRQLGETSRANDNRLLVMMMDFVEDTDAATTGNGKFLHSDDEYILDLGKPPHDQEYYWWIMESVRYYYQAASLGCYDLEFDIYPEAAYSETDTTIIAYTLPHEMSYYNPPGADTDLMISRFEEYFHDVFTTVDADSSVDFSQYAHFMIIHAGSDYQHDTAGNTRADIPSFFIHVGEGKEVIVDDGIVIDHACNVPETISQDGQYGVTTAVTAHEFGHSLGFIDLYSTLTGSPQVGWFDIMDSGGMGELIVDEIDGEYITIEGGLPTLPSAWHRILAWEDYFRENGMLVDIDELDWSESIRIEPAEKLISGFNSVYPYFIKIPLTDKEYILIENRQVDPDGDSGLSFKGALAQYPDSPDPGYRVLWYPTYPSTDPRDDPNWEYDLFIPGWQKNGDDGIIYNYGGGLVIWYIDERIIYEEGIWEDGEFYSNYDQNTVNALHSKRGIRVIEADGFDDIGNYDDGYNIMGSAYDPFYRYYPRLSESGNFLGWDNQGIIPGYQPVNEDEFIHTIEFNGSSFPRLETNAGDPFMFGLWDISSYSVDVNIERSMSFRYGSHLFDEINVIAEYDEITGLSGVTEILGFPSFAVVSHNEIELMNLIGEEWDNYLDVHIPYAQIPSQPQISSDIDGDSEKEILIVADSILTILDGVEYRQEELSAEFSDAPLCFDHEGQNLVVYPLADKLIIAGEELPIPGARLSYDGEYLIAANSDHFWFIDPETKEIVSEYELSFSESAYYPIVFLSQTEDEKMCFQVSEGGEIWRITVEEKQKIFNCSNYSGSAPSQLLLTPLHESGRTWVVFAAGEYLFAITDKGTLAEGFPVYMEDHNIEPESWLQSMKLDGEYLLLLQRDTGSRFAINEAGDYRIDYSGVNSGNIAQSSYWYDGIFQELNWFGVEGKENLLKGKLKEIAENPIINCGYRNNEYNIFTGINTAETDVPEGFRAFAFPNPTQDNHAIVRVFEAGGDINLKLFDIAGNLVQEYNKELEANPHQDIPLELNGISSGVYYARIKSKGKTLTVPLGIEK